MGYKLWVFRAIALSIPVVFFGVIELGLRVANFGGEYGLFIEFPEAPVYKLPRPDVVKRYFPPGYSVPTLNIEPNFFRKEKKDGAIRIFVQGGSTAAGFPYGIGASPSAMLDYRLKQSFPRRDVEVVNTAMSAVNSHTLLDFSEEIIAERPDAVVIYAGHNEYLGLLGVGSAYSATSSYWLTRASLSLKNLRIYQAIQMVIWSGVGADNSAPNEPRTLMGRVAKKKDIRYESELYKSGLQQFERNLNALLVRYKRAGVPVFLSTIASNLKDMPPFRSQELEPELRQRLDGALDELVQKWDSQRASAVLQSFSEAQSARHCFDLAALAYEHNNLELAKTGYTLARDYDLLRFRAPSPVNQIITRLAAKHGAYLVDAAAAIESDAPGGIVGAEHMLEHLHPNVRGYFLISDALYDSLLGSSVFGEPTRYVSKEEAENDIPLLPPEYFFGRAKAAELTSGYPFVSQAQKTQYPKPLSAYDQLGFKMATEGLTWLEMTQKVLDSSRDNTSEFVKAAKLLSDAVPINGQYAYVAGGALVNANRPEEAPRYFLRAAEADPTQVSYQTALIHSLVLVGEKEAAVPWVKSVLLLDSENAFAKAMAKRLALKPL